MAFHQRGTVSHGNGNFKNTSNDSTSRKDENVPCHTTPATCGNGRFPFQTAAAAAAAAAAAVARLPLLGAGSDNLLLNKTSGETARGQQQEHYRHNGTCCRGHDEDEDEEESVAEGGSGHRNGSVVHGANKLAAHGKHGQRAEIDEDSGGGSEEERLRRMSAAVRTLLECVGEDPDREGLRATPMRMAKALLYCTKGYDQTVAGVVGGAVFEEDHSEMVVVKDINVFSMCEHHMVPFLGKVHIGYIPRSKVLGLSKLARIAEMYARRLQIQERLTKQIAQAINEAIQPLGVAVVIEAT